MRLRPFFSFYGGKWRAARTYPEPQYGRIIEPFAGSAGYSVHHSMYDVHLYDADPVIVGVWNYLIHATSDEILRLPLDVWAGIPEALPQEARWLIGFWMNHATTYPAHRPSAWMRRGHHATSFWSERIRHRLATQVGHIRHWSVTCGDYTQCPNECATWFVDPPYQVNGRHYRHHSVDYQMLGDWCRRCHGQVIVCEQHGADWLPFRSQSLAKSRRGTSHEVVWIS